MIGFADARDPLFPSSGRAPLLAEGLERAIGPSQARILMRDSRALEFPQEDMNRFFGNYGIAGNCGASLPIRIIRGVA